MMLDINITFKSVNLEDYDPKVGAKVKIVFNDGLQDRVFMKTFAGGKVDGLSDSILKDIRDFEKKQSQTDSEDPFDVINIKFENEDRMSEKITNFFEKIAQELKFVKNYSQGSSYLGVVNKLKNIKFNF